MHTLERALALVLILCGAGTSTAQIVPGARVQTFVEDDLDGDSGSTPVEEQRAEAEADQSILEFRDGNQLHGSLVSLDLQANRVIWRAGSEAADIPIPIEDISKLLFHTHGTAGGSTLKLTGNNWLTCNVQRIGVDKVNAELPGGAPIEISRDELEWIYFPSVGKPAPECYDGPTSFSGWISRGGWVFRDGALRASTATAIGRRFEALPDKVEYFLEVSRDPRAGDAFSLVLNGRQPASRMQDPGSVSLMFLGNTLSMVAEVGGAQVTKQVAIENRTQAGNSPPGPSGNTVDDGKHFILRIFYDRPGGRLVTYVNGAQLANWSIDRQQGPNSGCLTFQQLGWSSSYEQAICHIRVLPWNGALPSPAQAKDSVACEAGPPKLGSIESMDGSNVTLQDGQAVTQIARSSAKLLAFHPADDPPDEDPPVAHITLAPWGEFDVTSLRFDGTQFAVATSFSSPLALPAGALKSIEFSRGEADRTANSDELIFRNGDRIKGALESAGADRKVRWKLARTGTAVEFEAGRVAGILPGEVSRPPHRRSWRDSAMETY